MTTLDLQVRFGLAEDPIRLISEGFCDCLHKVGVLSVGVRKMRDLLFGVSIIVTDLQMEYEPFFFQLFFQLFQVYFSGSPVTFHIPSHAHLEYGHF